MKAIAGGSGWLFRGSCLLTEHLMYTVAEDLDAFPFVALLSESGGFLGYVP